METAVSPIPLLEQRDPVVRRDLSASFPISIILVVKRTLPLLCGSLLVTVFLGFLYVRLQEIVGISRLPFSIPEFSGALFVMLGTICALKVVYEQLARRHQYYGIQGGNLVISKGILLKRRGSFPLSRITDVYLDRSISDLIFGLYNLHLSTPTVDSGRFARIEGLTRSVAVRLQDHLTAVLERSTSITKKAPVGTKRKRKKRLRIPVLRNKRRGPVHLKALPLNKAVNERP